MRGATVNGLALRKAKHTPGALHNLATAGSVFDTECCHKGSALGEVRRKCALHRMNGPMNPSEMESFLPTENADADKKLGARVVDRQ